MKAECPFQTLLDVFYAFLPQVYPNHGERPVINFRTNEIKKKYEDKQKRDYGNYSQDVRDEVWKEIDALRLLRKRKQEEVEKEEMETSSSDDDDDQEARKKAKVSATPPPP